MCTVGSALGERLSLQIILERALDGGHVGVVSWLADLPNFNPLVRSASPSEAAQGVELNSLDRAVRHGNAEIVTVLFRSIFHRRPAERIELSRTVDRYKAYRAVKGMRKFGQCSLTFIM